MATNTPKTDEGQGQGQSAVGARTHGALSTSTSSFEALDPHDPQLNHLASLMFTKCGQWIQGELEATADEYKLLEQMNRSGQLCMQSTLFRIIYEVFLF